MIDDAKVLIKLKKAGFADHIIAQKMGISVEQVQERWNDLQVLSKEVNGHGDFVMQYEHMCHQYQLLGESMKIVAHCIGAAMTFAEIRALIVPNDVDATIKNLHEKCIMLRPFVAVDPEESLRKHLKRVTSGN